MKWWHLPLAILLIVAIGGAIGYSLRPRRQVDNRPWRVGRTQAVLTTLMRWEAQGLLAVPVDVQRRPEGVEGSGGHVPGPLWAVVVDVLTPHEGRAGVMRMGCLVDAMEGRLHGCHGGKLAWLPAD